MKYEVTPFQAVVPAVPILENKAHPVSELRDDHIIRVTGADTLRTSLNFAKQTADAMLAECRARVNDGRPEAIIELLDANPAFVAVPWVVETLGNLVKSDRLRRRRGRPRGRRLFHPLVVVGLVRHLIAMGDAANTERALQLVEELRILPYGTAKDLYYRGASDDRFRAICLEFPDAAQVVGESNIRDMLQRVELVTPGREAHRIVDHPELGDVEITIRAL